MSFFQSPGLPSAVVFLLCLAAFLPTLSTSGSFDEFDYAMRVRQPGFFYHFNHFLPHVFAGISYRAFYFFTHSLDSLLATKIVNAIFGALNAWLVFRIVLRLSASVAVSFFAGLIYGLSFGTWKYSTSGEVYTIMMTALLACLLWFVRLLQTDDWSASSLLILAFLANLCVMCHNTTATIAIAMGVPLILKNPRLFLRYAVFGVLVFLAMQTLASVTHGIYTPRAWYNFAFHYGASGYATANNLVDYNLFHTLPITLRDGTVTILAGLETSFFKMSRPSQALTLLIYAAVFMAVFGSWWVFLKNGPSLAKRISKDGIFQALILHLVVFGLFYSCWTPGNDEFMHWFIPYEIFVCVYAFFILGVPQARVALSMALLVPLLVVSSLGTSRLSASKILSSRFAGYILDRDTKDFDFQKGDVVVYRYNEADQIPRYYFPGSTRIPPNETAEYLKSLPSAKDAGARVFITTNLLDDFPPVREGLSLTRVNPSYWRIDTLPAQWNMSENVRVFVTPGPALRETWPNPDGHVSPSLEI